jgi:hypothetical protein
MSETRAFPSKQRVVPCAREKDDLGMSDEVTYPKRQNGGTDERFDGRERKAWFCSIVSFGHYPPCKAKFHPHHFPQQSAAQFS